MSSPEFTPLFAEFAPPTSNPSPFEQASANKFPQQHWMWPLVRTRFSDQRTSSKPFRSTTGGKRNPSNMPTPSQEWDWENRYERDTVRPKPATHNIDHNWRLLKSLTNPDGGFNGGIDLVDNKVNGELAIRKRLCAHHNVRDHDHMRWRREILVMRKLSHPNIPHYIDGFFTPEQGSLYMQPCRLGSLSKWLDTHNKDFLVPEMQEFMLWHILHQIAEAILYMQTGFQNLADLNRSTRDKAQGWVVLVHGDIRTDQIFLDNPSNGPIVSALLGDFGFAQFIKPWHRTEVHDGPGAESSSKGPEFPYEISEATDVFGLGATAQQYVNRYEKPKAGLHLGHPTDFRISKELDHLICNCTAVRPSRRPNIREVVEKLEWGIASQKAEGYSLSCLEGEMFDTLFPSKRNYMGRMRIAGGSELREAGCMIIP